MTTRIVEVREGILKKNDRLAHELRARFESAGVFVVSFVSSPGAGKTRFLETALKRLVEGGSKVAAITGDLATRNDADRLGSSGAPVRQIETGGLCHLEAEMVAAHLEGWDLDELDYLFIENVGNLVCPSSYDLGESLRAAMLSVTEGEDKPLKYPTIFHSADIAILTKIDLAEACEFDESAALDNLQAVRPGIRVFRTSAKTAEGIAEWLSALEAIAR